MIDSHREQYRAWRRELPKMRVMDGNGDLVALEEIDDGEVEALCRREAERDVNRAIWEVEYADRRRRERRNEAR